MALVEARSSSAERHFDSISRLENLIAPTFQSNIITTRKSLSASAAVGDTRSHPDQAQLQKYQSRISSLESTLSFLQDEHSRQLEGLHAEVTRLQNLLAEANLRNVLTTPTDMTSRPDEREMHTEDDRTESTNEAPYNILLLQQKRKYIGFIERLNNDNKRKQCEIDSLKAELELIRDVLALSGLDIDLTELRTIVHNKDGTKASATKLFASRAKKIGILPPISPEIFSTDVLPPNLTPVVVEHGRTTLSQLLKGPKPSLAKSLDQANQAAELSLKIGVAEHTITDTVSTAVTSSAKKRYSRPQQKQLDPTNATISNDEPLLPKAKSPKPPTKSPTLPPINSHSPTTWSKRVQGAKLVRERRLKNKE